MRNFIFLILIIFVFVFLPFLNASAITPGTIPEAGKDGLPKSPITEPNQFLDVIASVVKWTYAIFFIITVMFVLFAAFNYLTGGDDAEKIKSAHQQIMYAAIAVAIALLAVGFSLIIKRFLNPSGGSNESGSRTQAPAVSSPQSSDRLNQVLPLNYVSPQTPSLNPSPNGLPYNPNVNYPSGVIPPLR